ncbi:uncharacterized protein B0I36DRAFT_368444 [Microdochium trichocladiopsis]|uniref:Uncharacterized protein n=1 Tax=Microdochium trichocladiopsis TaxID=1682393 RepID=A0A9P8XU61_9PEZI|nr:uncharacterized protein B0I36DRAFT_368444 [Microdochium trichocladiopsis]KAH7018425.1 hypothetical protein B0I36DRAFT_368444 [Microdochium trichocladiopsis]
MQRTLRAAQRAAASTKSAATAAKTTTAATTRAAPLPYAPPRLQQNHVASSYPAQTQPAAQPTPSPSPQSAPTRPTTTTTTTPPPVEKVLPGSPAYNRAASKYTRAMIAMPILLLTSYVLYGRFLGGQEEKVLPGAEGRAGGPKLVVLDK